MDTDARIPIPLTDRVAELAVARLPMLINDPAGEFYARLCIWVEHVTGEILSFKIVRPQPSYAADVFQSLDDLVKCTKGLPGTVLFDSRALFDDVGPKLEELGMEVKLEPSLPLLKKAIAGMARLEKAEGPRPGLFDVPGMTEDRVGAFADAAISFHRAQPWQHLIDDDLIEVESPAGPRGTRYAQVLGAAGLATGISFVASREDHDQLRNSGMPRSGLWRILLSEIDELPFDDGEAWIKRNLPVAGYDTYPSFLFFGQAFGYKYSSPAELTWAEGLLRAIADTTEAELDSGRWSKTVQTFAGPATYRFSLPLLLEQMDGKQIEDPSRMHVLAKAKMETMLRAIGRKLGPDATQEQMKALIAQMNSGNMPVVEPSTPAEKAQELASQAFQTRGRRQVQLARQALDIDPDCCEALIILAERIADPDQALDMFREAVAAGERQLGREFFEENAGHFWGIIETRPYMRARARVAQMLYTSGDSAEAANHFRELLRLNPGDNQGNRYELARALLDSDQLDELDSLLHRPDYSDDIGAEWVFTRALLAFRRQGDTPESRQALAEANQANRHVIPMLTGRTKIPSRSPMGYSLGSEEEAAILVPEVIDAWSEIDGASQWLQSFDSLMKKKAAKLRRERDGKKRKRR